MDVEERLFALEEAVERDTKYQITPHVSASAIQIATNERLVARMRLLEALSRQKAAGEAMKEALAAEIAEFDQYEDEVIVEWLGEDMGRRIIAARMRLTAWNSLEQGDGG